MPAPKKKKKSEFNKRALTPKDRGLQLLQILSHKNPKFINYKKALSLLRHGADVTVRDEDGWTALMLACLRGNSTSLVRAIIAAKADVNAVGNDPTNQETPLIIAIEMDKTDFIQPLIDAGANKDFQRPADGMTALMCAANGSLEISKILLKAEVDIYLKSHSGKTAIDIAHGFTNMLIAREIAAEHQRLLAARAAVLKTCAHANENMAAPDVVLQPKRKIRIEP